jgi:general secretion pathway protein G
MNRKDRGFTLIELVVVVAVLSILSSIIVPNVMDLIVQARNAFRASSMATLETTLAQYRFDNAAYPTTGGWWGERPGGYGNHPHEGNNAYIRWVTPPTGNYIRRLPADPTAGKHNPHVNSTCNGFLYNSNGANFKLLSHCAPENPGSRYGQEEWKYYDPIRPTWSWATYSSGSRNW